MELTKIVITGGPCAGKSTAMNWIQNALSERGYTVLFIPETATELISGGVAPWTCGSNLDYQHCQMRLQITKEQLFERAARTMKAEKILLVCDRGALDNKAYMSQEEFDKIMESIGLSEIELRDSYDAVFHLTTAAKGAEEFYTTANNAARTESPEQAIALDDKLIAAWTGHPHLRLIDNSTDFVEKMKRLTREITAFLGELEVMEVERKFLVSYPDLAWLENHPSCSKVEIMQTYLSAPEGMQRRIRQRGLSGHFVYSETIKRSGSDGKLLLSAERRLSQEEYLLLLMEADPERHPIRKTRYCLANENQYFEVDLFPFWKDQALLKVALSSMQAPIHMPDEIKVIREVTDDPNYKNAALAKISF